MWFMELAKEGQELREAEDALMDKVTETAREVHKQIWPVLVKHGLVLGGTGQEHVKLPVSDELSMTVTPNGLFVTEGNGLETITLLQVSKVETTPTFADIDSAEMLLALLDALVAEDGRERWEQWVEENYDDEETEDSEDGAFDPDGEE